MNSAFTYNYELLMSLISELEEAVKNLVSLESESF